MPRGRKKACFGDLYPAFSTEGKTFCSECKDDYECLATTQKKKGILGIHAK